MDDMIVLEFSPNGEAVSDFEAENWVISRMRNLLYHGQNEKKFSFSTSNIYYAARTLLAEKKISMKEISFRFKDEKDIWEWKNFSIENGLLVSEIFLNSELVRTKDFRPMIFCSHDICWLSRYNDALLQEKNRRCAEKTSSK